MCTFLGFALFPLCEWILALIHWGLPTCALPCFTLEKSKGEAEEGMTPNISSCTCALCVRLLSSLCFLCPAPRGGKEEARRCGKMQNVTERCGLDDQGSRQSDPLGVLFFLYGQTGLRRCHCLLVPSNPLFSTLLPICEDNPCQCSMPLPLPCHLWDPFVCSCSCQAARMLLF